MAHKPMIVLMIALILMGLTAACQPIRASPTPLADEVQLSFETIEMGQPVTHEKTWTDPASGLLVIATLADIEAARQYVSEEATTALEQLDFTSYLALLVFDGLKSEVYQDFQIQALTHQDAEVLIFAQPSHKPGAMSLDIVTSLYHLIKIPKSAKWDRMITFKFYFDRTQPATVTVEHYVP